MDRNISEIKMQLSCEAMAQSVNLVSAGKEWQQVIDFLPDNDIEVNGGQSEINITENDRRMSWMKCWSLVWFLGSVSKWWLCDKWKSKLRQQKEFYWNWVKTEFKWTERRLRTEEQWIKGMTT